MGKKENLNKYFKNFKQPELPKTTGSSDKKNTEKKTYSSHKIYDDPLNNDVESSINLNSNGIVEIDPGDIKLWIHKDRPENELGDLENFAKELQSVGQIQPGTVRILKNSSYKYELIIGERRWRACQIANIPFRAEIKNYTDCEAALAQAAENEERKELSDYAKGMSFANLIENNVLTQKDLIYRLGKSKQQISRLLSFRELPKELIDKISDMTKVSARTAEAIKQLCRKNNDNINILLSITDKIASGIGHQTLEKYINNFTNPANSINTDKVLSTHGRHLFTWRKDGNGNLSVSFPKDVRKKIDITKLQSVLSGEIESQLIETRKSPEGDF